MQYHIKTSSTGTLFSVYFSIFLSFSTSVVSFLLKWAIATYVASMRLTAVKTSIIRIQVVSLFWSYGSSGNGSNYHWLCSICEQRLVLFRLFKMCLRVIGLELSLTIGNREAVGLMHGKCGSYAVNAIS